MGRKSRQKADKRNQLQSGRAAKSSLMKTAQLPSLARSKGPVSVICDPPAAQGESPQDLAVAASPDAQARAECGRQALELVSTDPEVLKLVNTFTNLRRSAVVVYQALTEQLSLRADLRPELLDYLIGMAIFDASRPFEVHDWIMEVAKSDMPTLVALADKLTDKEAVERAKEKEERERRLMEVEKARQATPIDIGFPWFPVQDSCTVDRKQSVVFVGGANCVFGAIRKVITKATQDGLVVVHLAADAWPYPVADGDKDIFSPEHEWRNCTNTQTAMRLFVHSTLRPRMPKPPDLIVCSNLPAANSTGFVGRDPGALAGDSHKMLRTLATVLGAGFVGGVPLPEGAELPDPHSTAYEQLRTFSMLCPVRGEVTKDGMLSLRVGDAVTPITVAPGSLRERLLI